MFLFSYKAFQQVLLAHPLLWVWMLTLGVGQVKVTAQNLYPGNDLKFEHISFTHGLPESLVWSIYQDWEGFMWFGTYSGLIKYDGYRATIWKADPTDSNYALRSNHIGEIHDDRRGNLWFPTYGAGLHQLDKRTGKVKVYPIDSLQASGWDKARGIFEDRQENLWLSCESGLARFDPYTRKYTLYLSPVGQTIDFKQKDDQGRLWGINQEGLWQFNRQNRKYTRIPLLTVSGSKIEANTFLLDEAGTAWISSNAEGLFYLDTRTPGQPAISYRPAGLISEIGRNGLCEANGYLWVATSRGLLRINKQTDQVISYVSNPALTGSLSYNNLTAVYKDRMDNLWIGMFSGLNKASLLANPFYTHQIIPAPAPFYRQENVITSILEDHTGIVWVVSQAKGLYWFDPNSHQFMQVVMNPKDTLTSLSDHIMPLCEDNQGRLWVGRAREKELYSLDRATGRFTRYACEIVVHHLKMDPAGKLWISGRTEGLAYFDPLTEKFTYFRADEKDTTTLLPGVIHDLLVSRTGEVWVATTQGLSRLDPKTGRFTHYYPNYRTGLGYFHDPALWCLYEDRQGILWVGSIAGGLNRFDPYSGLFTHFTTRDGLPSNRVNSIAGDRRGNLWIGTDKGLSRYHPSSNTFRTFDTSDGLPSAPFFYNHSVYSHQDKLFFGTYSGFVIFNPDSIKEKATVPPPFYITGFKVMESNRPLPTDKIELAFDENFFSFEFVAIDYEAAEKNQYAYQLVGIDKDWVYSGSRRLASYTDVGPGTYRFRVKVTSDSKIWNEKEMDFNIIIYPPFWRTIWAYIFYGICLAAGVFTIDRFQRRRLIQKEREKARERELVQAKEIEQAYHQLGLKSTELIHQKEELQCTLEHLKATQAELVQQEKAGLEHELKLERLQKEQELATYQNRTAELEMQALRAQMNPHFIFNCLNSINRFILKNESEAASDYLTKFSKLIRLILQNSQSHSVSLEKELEALRLYIEMEMLRFEGQFEYRILYHPDLEIEDLEVPPLVIQPYVENAIWHGLMHKQDKGHLVIELQRKNGILYCQITDDGVGRKRAAELKSKSASKSKSLGMQITAHRLELINGLSDKATTVEVTDLVGCSGEACGTRVLLKIPV